MSDCIKVYMDKSEEYKRLSEAATRLTEASPTGRKYFVGRTWFDFGSNLEWTTILAESKWGSYQALCPRDQERILEADTDDKMYEAVRKVLADPFCPDKLR